METYIEVHIKEYRRKDGTFVKEGSSTLILTKANTNKGLTRVNNGKLELGNNSNIGAVTVANIAGASLDIDGGTATIRSLNGGDNSDIDFGTDGTLIVYQNANGDFEDFTAFDIGFDFFYKTSSEENISFVQDVFKKIEKNGHIYEKEIIQFYCNNDLGFGLTGALGTVSVTIS